MGEYICKDPSDKGLLKLKNKTMGLIFKMAKVLNRHLSKEDKEINKHAKSCSTSSVIGEMQIKQERDDHCILNRMAKIGNTDNTIPGYKKTGNSFMHSGYSHSGKEFGSLLKN